jgi:asparagine synthetase B (glutamine-hydrolysing)
MIKFNPEFILPELILKCSPVGANEPSEQKKYDHKVTAENSEFRFSFEYSNVNPTPVKFEDGKFITLFLGAPIVGDGIDHHAALALISDETGINKDKLQALNGEFLIIRFDKETSELVIANDRFTSFPLFYHHDRKTKSFFASIYFSSLWDFLKKSNKLEIDHNAFFEFYWLQRLLGTKTFAKNTFFLEDASRLSFHYDKLNIQRYWQRDYRKSEKSLAKHSHMMADFVRQSVARKTSDQKRFGHFLSGGMDSRSVFAAFAEEPPVCFTATIGENREFRKAAEIAAVKNAKHIGLELDPEHFGKIYRHSTRVIGGMYNYDHGLFYGFDNAVKEHADVCFHGHGFDYMFQGMYIPKRNVKVAGRQLYVNFLKELPEDLVTYFINNASYRIKRADVWAFVNDSRKDELKEFQRASIAEILEKGKQITENQNDLWEYLTFHHISRHYSYPNHASIATFAEQRTVSFDNDLFNLYLSLPVEHRINGKIEKACLKILDPAIAKIWSANTNLPVTASCWTQTAYQLAGFIKRRIIPEEEKPEWQERTWPERQDALREQDLLKQAINDLCVSDTLEQIDFLDIGKIRKDIPKWLDGENVPGVSGDLVQTILTMGTFLEQ